MALTLLQELLFLLPENEQRDLLDQLAANEKHTGQPAAVVADWLSEHVTELPDIKDLTRRVQALGYKPAYAKNLLSDIGEEVRNYITARERRRHPLEEKIAFLESLLGLNAPFHLFLRHWKQAWQILKKEAPRSIRLLHSELKMIQLRYEAESLLQHRGAKSGKRDTFPGGPVLPEAITALDRYFLIQRSKWLLEWENQQKITVQPEMRPGMLPWDDWIGISEWENVDPVLGPLFDGLRTLFREGKGYRELKEKLIASPPAAGEHLHCCLYLQNFCAGQINRGNMETFLREFLFWSDYRAQNGIFLHQGRLSHGDFKNYVTCCLKSDPPDTDRAAAFVKQFSSVLAPPYQEEAVGFCLANIQYHREDFAGARQHLQAHKFRDPLTKADAKTLKIKVLYELNDLQEFESAMESAKQYFYRNPLLTDTRRRALANKLRFLDRLWKCPPRDMNCLRNLKQEIDEEEHVSDRQWLIQKLNDRMRGK